MALPVLRRATLGCWLWGARAEARKGVQMPVNHSGGMWWLGPWRGRCAEEQPGSECFLKGVPTRLTSRLEMECETTQRLKVCGPSKYRNGGTSQGQGKDGGWSRGRQSDGRPAADGSHR